MCHMSHVTCHMSRVTCHVSCVTCHMSHFFSSLEVYWWRVCYQRGLPRLVFLPWPFFSLFWHGTTLSLYLFFRLFSTLLFIPYTSQSEAEKRPRGRNTLLHSRNFCTKTAPSFSPGCLKRIIYGTYSLEMQRTNQLNPHTRFLTKIFRRSFLW